MRQFLTHVLLLGIAAPGLAFGEDTPVIKPEDARQHLDQKCETTFKVRHTKHGVNRKTYFLDSQEDFRSEKNLGVQVSEEMAARLKEKKGIGEPHLHYADKTIRVVGKIFLQEDRPYLRIENVDDISIVEEKP